jgi:hypothetical protein
MWVKWHHSLHRITGEMAKSGGQLSNEQLLQIAAELQRIANDILENTK